MSNAFETIIRNQSELLSRKESAEALGPEETAGSREALKKDIQNALRGNDRWYIICIILVVILFGVSLYLGIKSRDGSGTEKVMASVLGVSAAGIISYMFVLWRTKTSLELLLALAVNLEGESLKQVIIVLSDYLKVKAGAGFDTARIPQPKPNGSPTGNPSAPPKAD